MRRGIGAAIILMAFVAVLPTPAQGRARGVSEPGPPLTAEAVKQLIEKRAGSIQRITFPDTAWSPVKVLRGNSPAKDATAEKSEEDKAEIAETVTFADPSARPVRVVRGEADRVGVMPGPRRPANAMIMQLVTFADARDRPVTIFRGSALHSPDFEPFGPALVADLDRVAFAVDGAESSHGADLRMWRPEPGGPQGPMQITAAAAIDVGSGNRYDLAENRVLGRAYLARMYRRYGNWPDAVAAYNWGPGNLNSWISSGRMASKLPLEVEHYRDRVLGDAALAEPVFKAPLGGVPPRPMALPGESSRGSISAAAAVESALLPRAEPEYSVTRKPVD